MKGDVHLDKGRSSMAPAKTWESWRTQFQQRVKDEVKRRGITQKDLAELLGLANSSSVSYHVTTAGGGPTYEFVQQIAQLWPEEFSSSPAEFHVAKYGVGNGDTVAAMRSSRLIACLDGIEAAISELRAAILEYASGGDDDVTSTADHQNS